MHVLSFIQHNMPPFQFHKNNISNTEVDMFRVRD